MTGSRHRTGHRVVYALWVVIVTFVLLEAVLRLLDLAPAIGAYGKSVPDRFLPFKPRPSSVLTERTKEWHYEVRHNRFGFRDVEHALTKPAGTFRILGLGDSFTYGAGAEFTRTYLYRLEEMLNSRESEHPEIEIIKAGIYRFFPEPERLLLQHYGVKFSPDLILVAFLPNDVVDTYLGIDALRVGPTGRLTTPEGRRLGRAGVFLYEHCHACRIALQHSVALVRAIRYRPRLDDIYASGGFHERDWQRVESEYARMVRIADVIDAEIVFLHLPQERPWDKRASYPAERLRAWARRHGVHFVDALPALKAFKGGDLGDLYYQEGHCRPSGYQVIAEVLFDELTRRGLVP